MDEIERVVSALFFLDPGCARETWVRIAMASKAAGISFEEFHEWSASAPNYSGERDCASTWKSLNESGPVTAATLFAMAREKGWENPKRQGVVNSIEAKVPLSASPFALAPDPLDKEATPAPEIWKRFEQATVFHPYVVQKQAAGVPLDMLRVVPDKDPLRIAGESMAGALVVPVFRHDGEIASLQFVLPPDTAARLKAKGKPGKLNLPGCAMQGWHVVGELMPGGVVYVCEGIAQAWSCWQATEKAAVVCFGWGKVRAVAAELRKRDRDAKLVLVPDVGKEGAAEAVAREVSAFVAYMPEGEAQNADVNDYAIREGNDALAALLARATAPKIVLPLEVAFADELPSVFAPADELVEGILTAGDASMLFGDSNSGKTFLAIDLACAVARGVPWMNKQTEAGLVVYLAAESPASVRARLQAYQKYHKVRVPNFAIVQSPIDLFDSDADTDAVIALVRQLEVHRGEKVRLVIGDTLARLSAGANENAGQDMGLIVRRIDRIRTECGVHFMVIHHSGKNAAAGSRGWSGIRAAVDTEIEVTSSPAGRCAEITKQRDLPTNGERIGFQLETVMLGLTKWKGLATSCVVLPAAAPEKSTGKRISEVGGAILEMLRTRGFGMKKREVVKHFDGQYDSTSVYREMKKLVEAGQVYEVAGVVTIAKNQVEVCAN
jgi:putative DNA primase/helicase